MAMSDYMQCDRCERKAYYDADTEYGGAAVWALCGKCAESYRFVLETKGATE